MSANIGPTAVWLTVSLAEVPAAPALVAEGIPADITKAGSGYCTLRVSYDGDDVSWVPTDDGTPVGVRIDTAESKLTITTETDTPEIPPAIHAVNRAVQECFNCIPSDEPPSYLFELGVSYEQIKTALDRDNVTLRSIDDTSPVIEYEYEGIQYRIRTDGTVLISGGIDDPTSAIATLTTHLKQRVSIGDPDSR
jgi:hypothetical protein